MSIRYKDNTCDYFPTSAGLRDNKRINSIRYNFGDTFNGTSSGNPAGAAGIVHAATYTGGSGAGLSESNADSGRSAVGVKILINSDKFRTVNIVMPYFYFGVLRAGSNTTLGSGFVPIIGGFLGGFTGKSTSRAGYTVNATFAAGSAKFDARIGTDNIFGTNGVGGSAKEVRKSGLAVSDYQLVEGLLHVATIEINTSDSYTTALGANVAASSAFRPVDIQGQVNYGVMRWRYGLTPGYYLTRC